MPRPLVGYISNGVTLAAPFSVPGSASLSPATVSTTAPDAENMPLSPSSYVHAILPAGTTLNVIAVHPSARRIPAMPPAVRPCGRTFPASNVSSEESDAMNTRRSSSAASAANSTESPSLRSMTLQESIVVGASRFQRFTTPARVPMARGAGVGPSSSR